MKEVFPNVLEMSCTRRIQANPVSTRYGAQAGKHVMSMAKTYSILYFNTLLEQMSARRKPRPVLLITLSR